MSFSLSETINEEFDIDTEMNAVDQIIFNIFTHQNLILMKIIIIQ